MNEYLNLLTYTAEELYMLEQVVVRYLDDPERNHRQLLDSISELVVTATVRGEYVPICDADSEAQHPGRRAA